MASPGKIQLAVYPALAGCTDFPNPLKKYSAPVGNLNKKLKQ